MSLLQVRDLSVHLSDRTLVSGIDLDLAAGESLALVGESGSGKSLTSRAIIGLLPPGLTAGGSVTVNGVAMNDPGRARTIRGSVVSLLMQDPFTMLNPLKRVGVQLADAFPSNERRQMRSGGEIARRLAEVGLEPDVAARYPFQLSGGMRQRVALAAALMRDPQLLIADEPTTALDVTVQRDVLRLIADLQRQRGMGFLLITHDLRVAFSVCQRIVVLYAGKMLEAGPAQRVRDATAHPYTNALLSAEPPMDRRVAGLRSVAGAVPRHDDVVGQCPFAPRCSLAIEECWAGPVELRQVEEAHWTACLRPADAMLGRSIAPAEEAGSTRKSAPALLSVNHLGKTFGGASQAAIADATLEVREGESVGLVGGSGSGKTTLARCVVGLEIPSRGGIELDGVDVTSWMRLSRAQRRPLRRTVQMVFQDPYSSLNPMRTVGNTLREALAAVDEPSGKDAAKRLLELVQLPQEMAEKRPPALSGGERQRVAIARALAGNPRLLVCDESVSALDVSVQAQIIDLLRELRQQMRMALLFIAHDLAVVRQVCDYVYVMERGAIVEYGEAADVLSTPRHEYTKALIRSVPRDDPGWLST